MYNLSFKRIENQTAKFKYDVFETIYNDRSDSGILDDIRDLRRYLLLVEELRIIFLGLVSLLILFPKKSNTDLFLFLKFLLIFF